jgi:hypothetical protein
MAKVLISGMAELATQVADALRSRDTEVTEVHDLDQIPQVCTSAGPDAFDSYVQLPATFSVRGDTAIRRVHHFYADGVLRRFSALAHVLPTLTNPARVTFVLGHLPTDVSTPSDHQARQSLVEVLGHAARADAGGKLDVRVLDYAATPQDIMMVALGRDPVHEDLLSRLSELSYQEWRVELMGLVSVET